jgi:hypothetical protein
MSLMCATWVGNGEEVMEGWIAGAAMDFIGRVTGLFFQTLDGGLTYQLQQVAPPPQPSLTLISPPLLSPSQSLDNCFPLDMDFSSADFGLVSCVSATGLSSTIALYQ